MFIVDISLKDVVPILEKDQISCEGATIISGCIELNGTWDLEINGTIVLPNASVADIKTYLETGSGLVQQGEVCCDMGYYRPVSLAEAIINSGIQNGDTAYIPISLTKDGPSITSPITIDATPNLNGVIEWFDIGYDFTTKLNQQLEPYGLDAIWTNNEQEFGITSWKIQEDIKTVLKFYVLNEGNTFSSDDIKRGLPPVACFLPS